MAQKTQTAIIIPTYNMSKTVCRTIDSCLNQTVKAPIYVIDDGSTDGTYELLGSKYCDKIKLFRTEVNYGLSSAMNYVLKYVKEPFFIFTGADDILFSDNIENWSKNRLTDINYCRWESFKPIEPEKILPGIKNKLKRGLDNIYHTHQFYTNDGRHLIDGVGCMCLRTEMVKKEKFDSNLRYKEGGELLIRLALEGYEFRYFNFNGGRKIGFCKSIRRKENEQAIEYIKKKINDTYISR